MIQIELFPRRRDRPGCFGFVQGKAQSFPALTVSRGLLAGAGVVTVYPNAAIVDGGTMSGSGTAVLMPACVSGFTSFAADRALAGNGGTATITGKCSMWNRRCFSDQAGANPRPGFNRRGDHRIGGCVQRKLKREGRQHLLEPDQGRRVSTAMDSGMTCTTRA